MPADQPTILATSGGYRRAQRISFEFNSLVHHAVELSGATGRPRVTHLPTASGDQRSLGDDMTEAARVAGFDFTNLYLFPMPNLDDIEGHLLEQDVVWVNGGSVAGLLAMWEVHELRPSSGGSGRRAWSSPASRPGRSAGMPGARPTRSAPSSAR